MRKNKKRDMTPFHMKKVKRQSTLFLPLVWLASRVMVHGKNLRVDREGIKDLKPPYLVLSMHQGFADYAITPLALYPHRASFVSDIEGFANYGPWLYSKIGCVPTRRFAGDLETVRSIRQVVRDNQDIIVVFPEARHSNVGTQSKLPLSIGKLISLLDIPVVVQKLHGSYLSAPIWDEQNARRVPLESKLELILTPEEIAQMDATAITNCVNEHFYYDEYRWQYDNQIRIDNPNRARGLHKMLYLCPHCGREGLMDSVGAELFCTACAKRWEMDPFGRLNTREGETEFPHIPDWYEYQRQSLKDWLASHDYAYEAQVRIEALPNAKGFVDMGQGTLLHEEKGFTLSFAQGGKPLFFPSKTMPSLHTECDYHGKGDCVVLSTPQCCYYLYPVHGQLGMTKLQFAAEIFYEMSQE